MADARSFSDCAGDDVSILVVPLGDNELPIVERSDN